MKLLICICFFITSPLFAEHVIICGSGGDPQYSEQFATWGAQLRDLLTQEMGQEVEGVHFFLESNKAKAVGGKAVNLEQLRTFFAELARNHNKNDELFLYLIGHGSYLRQQAKFQIPGPDLTATELDILISAVPAKKVTLISGASSGAGFLNVLSKPGRIICSATRSVGEKSAPQFMTHFLAGLQDGSADQNRDTRISVYEAAAQAAALTGAWYLSEGLIATEHAILDDNGDALGSRLNQESKGSQEAQLDGSLARDVYLKSFSFPAQVPQTLIDEYLRAMEGVELLQKRKASLSQAAYWRELEQKMLVAARIHQKIKDLAEPR